MASTNIQPGEVVGIKDSPFTWTVDSVKMNLRNGIQYRVGRQSGWGRIYRTVPVDIIRQAKGYARA